MTLVITRVTRDDDPNRILVPTTVNLALALALVLFGRQHKTLARLMQNPRRGLPIEGSYIIAWTLPIVNPEHKRNL